MDFFSNWLLSHTLTTAAQALVSVLFSDDLRRRLTQSAEEWRSQLPSDAELLSIEALLPSPASGLIDNPPPQPNEIFNKLEKYEIPRAADWSAALLRQWRWVSETLEEPQAFFRLPESRAETHVEELAKRLELECQKDVEIFRVQSLKNDEAQLQAIEAVSARLSNGSRATSAQDAVIQTRIERLLTKLESGEEKRAAIQSNFHAQIDRAVEYTQKGQPDVAIAQIEDLRKHRWDDLDDRQRFRVVANIGHAYDAKEERTTAARHFIECKEYQPDDEKARCLEAIGYSMLGNDQQAFDLSVQVRADFPTSDLGTATWVRSAPGEMSFDEIEGDIALHLRHSVETAFALSVRALKAGEVGKAEEYARAALADDENSAMLLENLGIVLLESSRVEAAAQYAERPNLPNSGRLEEALALLEKSLEKSPNVSATRARNRFYLGITLQLLGKWDEAEDHLHAAYDTHPTNVGYARQYSIALCDRGDQDRAISILKSTYHEDDSRQSVVLLAHLLAARNESNDRDEAARLLTAEIEHLTEIELNVRSDIVATLVDLHGLIGCYNDAARVVEESYAALPPEALHAIRAAQFHRAEETELAKQECRAALASISADTNRREKRRVANKLMQLGMYEEALRLWKELVEPRYLGIDTPALLQAAVQCDEDKFIVHFCAELRANSIFDREAFHLEIDTLQEYNCFDTASMAMQEYLSAHTETALWKEIRLRLSHLGIALGRDELVDYDRSHLPSVDAVDPGLGLAVVEVLSNGPEPIQGVEYAYDLLRCNFSSHFAHKAMVVAFLFGRRADLKLPEPETAGPGVAVRYKDNETGQLHWYIIEDSSDPDPARDEYPSEHGLAKEMGGKRQGETFWLRHDPVHERTATIIDIWSKFKFRFNRCMEEWENRFPEKFFLWRFEAKKDEQGKTDFSQMFRSIDDRTAKTCEREEVYRNNPFSVTNFAIMAGATVLESVQHLGANQDLPIRCSAGTDEDYGAAEEAIRGASSVILDGSALATLFISGFYRELGKLPLQYVVTHGTLQELRRRYLEKLNSPRERGFMTKQEDQFVFIEERPEDIKQHLGAFGQFLETIKTVARIEEGLALAEYDRQRRRQWIDIFGRAGAETIALAQLNGYVLWTDDVCIAAIANHDQCLPRVWTESVAEWAFHEKRVTLETRNQLIIMLVSHGYHYTRMHPDTVLWAAEQSDWKTDDPSFEVVLRWLSNPFTKRIGIFGIAAKLLLEASRGIGSPFRMDDVNTQILSHVSQRPDGRKIIRELLNSMDEICGLDVVTARDLKLTIQAWRTTRL